MYKMRSLIEMKGQEDLATTESQLRRMLLQKASEGARY